MLKTKKQLMSSTPWMMEEEAEAEFPERKLKVTSQPGLTPTMHVTRKKTKRSQDQDNQDSLTEINPELRYSFQRNFQFLQRMFSIDTVVKPLHSTDGKLHFLSQLQVWKQEPSVLAKLEVQARELLDELESEILGNHQDNRKPCFCSLHGEEDLAREALKRRKSFADSGNILKSQLDQQKAVVDNLVFNTRLLESKIQEARSKKDTLKLRIMGVTH
ncbi:hypothetical protein ACFX15_002377 [Malus domestica]